MSKKMNCFVYENLKEMKSHPGFAMLKNKIVFCLQSLKLLKIHKVGNSLKYKDKIKGVGRRPFVIISKSSKLDKRDLRKIQ